MLGRRFPLFQTRSLERDNRSDATRREAIRNVIERQKHDAESERSGLEARMEEAYERAALMLDSAEDYSQRASADEQAIRDFEASAEAARQRIKVLDAELTLFEGLLERLGADAQGSDGTGKPAGSGT